MTAAFPHQARPTTYKRIEFRSKSEAIFARCLDLNGWLWNYEPKHWKTTDGWTPDFWVAMDYTGGTGNLLSAAVEYKPSKPSDSYLNDIDRRILSIKERFIGHASLVMFGSPFDQEIEQGALLFTPHCPDGRRWTSVDFLMGRVASLFDVARHHRFDLEPST